jgi:hypothetical protein
MYPAAAPAPNNGKRRGHHAGRLSAVLLISGFSIVLTLFSLKLLLVPMGWLGLDLSGDFVSDVDPGSAAAIAGVRAGDRLAPDTPFFVRQTIAFSNHFGRADYSFDVVRNGGLQHITAIATKPEPGSDQLDMLPFRSSLPQSSSSSFARSSQRSCFSPTPIA